MLVTEKQGDDAVIQTKNHLLCLIDDADTYAKIVQVSSTLLTILEHTEGLWIAANYTYKASEIAKRLIDSIDRLLLDDNLHNASKRKLRTVKSNLYQMSEHYRQLNFERFNQVYA